MREKPGKEWDLKKQGISIASLSIRSNPNTVYAAAIGNPYGNHPDRGVYKTTDGGETWNKILYVNDTRVVPNW